MFGVTGTEWSTTEAQATISAVNPSHSGRVICSTDQNGTSLLILWSALFEQTQCRRKEQMSSLNEPRQLSLLLLEFWSQPGWMGVQTVNHYHYLLTWIIWRGSIKYFVSKKSLSYFPVWKDEVFLSLINTDKLSSQAEKVTVSNFCRGKLALISSKNSRSYRKRWCYTSQRQSRAGDWSAVLTV